MTKKMDLNKSVYELVNEYPELVDILVELGFNEVNKKTMLHSVGKIMTIPKGAKMKNRSMMEIINTLKDRGFEIEEAKVEKEHCCSEHHCSTNESTDRTEELMEYLKRLGEGEDFETVRHDFVENFKNVDASQIMEAEQELLKRGTPLSQVQKLCDVHSALFHDMTNQEKNQQSSLNETEILGHPLSTFTKGNDAFLRLLEEFETQKEEALFLEFRDLAIHYAKKGDLLYPHLKVKYGVSGPSDVMWSVDDEIRDELNFLIKETKHDGTWYQRLDKVLQRAKEMVYKEQNILFPICVENFTKEEWYQIYFDSKDYSSCFHVENEKWDEAENQFKAQEVSIEGEIVMPGGHMTVEQLTALLNTIPLEISFIDDTNINCFFNEGPKVFKRPKMAIDREVFTCHPPKIEKMVKAIIDDFRKGIRDQVPVWMEKNGRSYLVTYRAVRDQNKKYLGTVELVQDMEFAKAHFTQ